MKRKFLVQLLATAIEEEKRIFQEILDQDDLAGSTIGRKTECLMDDQGKEHCNLLVGDNSLIQYLKDHNYRYETYEIVKGEISEWNMTEKGKIVPATNGEYKFKRTLRMYMISDDIHIKKVEG